jgi:flagellar motor switch protein FliN/FliY
MSIPNTLETLIAELIGEYANRLTASLEMLTGEPVQALPCDDTPTSEGENPDTLPWLWHAYRLSTIPAGEIWIGATAMVGNAIGTKVLLAAGIDEMTASDVQGSYDEVQRGAVSAVAQWIGKQLGEEVTLHSSDAIGGTPPADRRHLLRVVVGQEQLDPLCIALSESSCSLLQRLIPGSVASSQVATADPVREANGSEVVGDRARAEVSRTEERTQELESILDFELPMTVSFGKVHLPLREVLRLSTGSIIELDRSIGDPVEIIVNRRVVGRGAVVVVDGNYGVRIQQIMARAG